jgi:hypothetical protein
MTEKNSGRFPESLPPSSGDLSMKLRWYFEDLDPKSEKFETWVKSLDDIIGLREQKQTAEAARNRATESMVLDDKLHAIDESYRSAARYKDINRKMGEDPLYALAFARITHVAYGMEDVYKKEGNNNPATATSEALKGVKEYVQGLRG